MSQISEMGNEKGKMKKSLRSGWGHIDFPSAVKAVKRVDAGVRREPSACRTGQRLRRRNPCTRDDYQIIKLSDHQIGSGPWSVVTMKNEATGRWFLVSRSQAGRSGLRHRAGLWGFAIFCGIQGYRYEWEGTSKRGRREFRKFARIGEAGGQGRRDGYATDGGERATMAFRIFQDISGYFRIVQRNSYRNTNIPEELLKSGFWEGDAAQLVTDRRDGYSQIFADKKFFVEGGLDVSGPTEGKGRTCNPALTRGVVLPR